MLAATHLHHQQHFAQLAVERDIAQAQDIISKE